MRAFIAIELPLEIVNNLAKIQDNLRAALPTVSWVKPANLHITLKFLGEISLTQLENTRQILERIAKNHSIFKISLEALDVFPQSRQARIIWVATQYPPLGLKELALQLEEKFLEIGVPRELRPFQAHITLGRIKYPLPAEIIEKTLTNLKDEITKMDLKFDAQAITLFQSLLGPGGPTYQSLHKWFFIPQL